MNYFLYLLQSEIKETYYIGSSDTPERRHYFHNHDSKGYTLLFRPRNLVFIQEFDSREEALAAERKVKSWKSKKMIRLLSEGKIAIGDYLD